MRNKVQTKKPEHSQHKGTIAMPKKVYNAVINPKPKMFIFECLDPRFRKAFRHFTSEELHVGMEDFIKVERAGGAAALAHPVKQRDAYLDLLKQIAFATKHFSTIETVVIIGHQNCGFYSEIPDHPEKEDPEKKDLPRVAKNIRDEFPNLKVECYYAYFVDDNRTQISFEKIV